MFFLICIQYVCNQLFFSNYHAGSYQQDLQELVAQQARSPSPPHVPSSPSSYSSSSPEQTKNDTDKFMTLKNRILGFNNEQVTNVMSEHQDKRRSEENTTEYSSASKRKRTEEKQSTGTLKLVFKRRTTDNFVVKSSIEDPKKIPKELKPVVNLEKSDSEYEFDHRSKLGSQPVIVRRRSSVSVPSRQTSYEARSNYSFSRNTSKQSSEGDFEDEEEDGEEDDDDHEEEEDGAEDGDEEEEDGDEEEEADEESSHEAEEEEMEMEECTDEASSVIENSLDQSSICDKNVEDDAFDNSLPPKLPIAQEHLQPKMPHLKIPDKINYSNITSVSEVSHDSVSKEQPCGRITRDLSEASDDVFIPDLTYSASSSNTKRNSGNLFDNIHTDFGDSHDRRTSGNLFENINSDFGGKKTNYSTGSNRKSLPSPFLKEFPNSPPALAPEGFVAESPVKSMGKEPIHQGLNSSLFTNSNNRTLLDTDDMFNSSDEDEENRSGFASSFSIDNRDPQNSMMNDSVRSAIDSVLNTDDNDDSHMGGWAPPRPTNTHPSKKRFA